MIRYFILKMYLILLFSIPVVSQNAITYIDKDSLKLDPFVRYGKLDNGFTYYIRHNNEPKNEVYIQMVVKAGNFHEDSLQTEYAHLLEHMGYKGTHNFPKLSKHIQQSGGYSHASTSDLYTWYWAKFSSKNQKLLKDGLSIIKDWSQNINLNQNSIDVERGAVLGEIRNGNIHQKWYQETAKAAIEHSSGYKGKTKFEGTKNIKNFNIEAFIRFYKDWYRPDLQAAIIVGDINVDSTETEIKKMFKGLNMPENPKDPLFAFTKHSIILNEQNHYNVHRDTSVIEPFLSIFIKRPNPAYSPKTKDDYRDVLILNLYQEILNPRINSIKEYDPPFTLVPSTQYANQQLYTLRINIRFDDFSISTMKQRFIKSINSLRNLNLGFTDNEFKTAKENVRKIYQNKKSTSTKYLGDDYKNHFTLGTAAPEPSQKKQMISKILEEIKLEDVQNAAINYSNLKENTNFLYYTHPKFKAPDSSLLESWISEALTTKIEEFIPQDRINTLSDVVKLPLGDPNVIKSKTKSIIGVTTIDLKNDVKIILKPVGNSKTIKIRASRPNKIPFSNKQEYLMAAIAPKAIDFIGAGPYTKFQLKEFTKDTEVQIYQKLERTEQIIIGTTKSNRMEDFFQLLYLYTQHPRMDNDAFKFGKVVNIVF